MMSKLTGQRKEIEPLGRGGLLVVVIGIARLAEGLERQDFFLTKFYPHRVTGRLDRGR